MTKYILAVVVDDKLQRLKFDTEELARSAQSVFGGTVIKKTEEDNQKGEQK